MAPLDKPELGDYESYEHFVEALVDWKTDFGRRLPTPLPEPSRSHWVWLIFWLISAVIASVAASGAGYIAVIATIGVLALIFIAMGVSGIAHRLCLLYSVMREIEKDLAVQRSALFQLKNHLVHNRLSVKVEALEERKWNKFLST